MPYKCGVCGNIQEFNGACTNCRTFNDYMAMVENARTIKRDCREILYGDNNCCGCNTTRRRIYLLVVSASFAIAAGVVYLGKFNDNYAHMAIVCGAVSALFLSASFCPDCALLGRC